LAGAAFFAGALAFTADFFTALFLAVATIMILLSCSVVHRTLAGQGFFTRRQLESPIESNTSPRRRLRVRQFVGRLETR
jgi:hypothetical protein